MKSINRKLLTKKIKIIYFLLFPVVLYSQQDNNGTSDNFVKKNIHISGEAGAYGEIYSMNGQPDRRPSATGRLFLRPTIDLFGLFQIPFEFLISTEGSSARQNINQFEINPRWSWGVLHAGDFTTEYSKYTLNGVRIRGGGIELTPGTFRFSTAAGFTQRSVPGGAQDGTFKRFLFATKIGFGNEQSSYFDLIFLRAKDEVSSLPQNESSLTILSPNGDDVLEIGALISIQWNSYNLGGAVKIELSRDGGNTFELIADNQPNVGFYNWTVSGPATFEAVVRITSVEKPEIFDISDNLFSIGTGEETKIVASPNNIINKNAVTPQENLILGSKGKVSFLQDVISFDYDVGGSVYSRDLRAPLLDSADIPSFISKIYKARVGTNYDYAFTTAISLRLKNFSTKIGYRRINPGYYSLGTAYLHNDISEISIRNSIRISKINLTLGYIRQSDNLIDQKLFTTARNIVTAGVNTNVTKEWLTSLTINLLSMQNDSNNDSTKIDFGNLSISTNNTFTISQKNFLRNINFNYSFQNSANKSYMLKNNTNTVNTINLGAGFGISENLNSNFSVGFVSSSLYDSVKAFTHNYTLRFQHKALSNKLNSSLSFSTAFHESSNTLRVSINSGYNLTEADNVGLALSIMKFNGSTYRGGNFSEIIASLNYNHRF